MVSLISRPIACSARIAWTDRQTDRHKPTSITLAAHAHWRLILWCNDDVNRKWFCSDHRRILECRQIQVFPLLPTLLYLAIIGTTEWSTCSSETRVCLSCLHWCHHDPWLCSCLRSRYLFLSAEDNQKIQYWSYSRCSWQSLAKIELKLLHAFKCHVSISWWAESISTLRPKGVALYIFSLTTLELKSDITWREVGIYEISFPNNKDMHNTYTIHTQKNHFVFCSNVTA